MGALLVPGCSGCTHTPLHGWALGHRPFPPLHSSQDRTPNEHSRTQTSFPTGPSSQSNVFASFSHGHGS